MFLDGCVLDEYAQMSPRVWGEILVPALADREGYAIFIGTPMGRNHFWEIWDRAQDDEEWLAQMYKASQTCILSAGTATRAARKEMSEEQYKQEFECSFQVGHPGRILRQADGGRRERRAYYLTFRGSPACLWIRRGIWELGI